MDIKTTSQIIPIDQLECWDKNPRFIQEKDYARLKRQIQQLGEYKPLIVYPENGRFVVLGGNMRLQAYRELGKKECWVSIQNPKNEKEKLELALSDNDRAGEYDDQKLAELIYPFKDEIHLEDFKIDIGQSIDLGMVLDRFAPTDEDDFDAEAEASKIKKPKSKRGEVYQLGKHRLMCGDATCKEDVEKLMDGKKADMVFTDPPYFEIIKENWDHQWKNKDDFLKWTDLWIDILLNYITEDSSLYICSQYPITSYFQLLFDKKLYLRSIIAMVFNRNRGNQSNYIRKYESILYYVKSNEFIFNGMTEKEEDYLNTWIEEKRIDSSSLNRFLGYKKNNFKRVKLNAKTESRSNNGRFLEDVWYCERPHGFSTPEDFRTEHPTQKPLKATMIATLNSSLKNQIVLDLFGGSGTTLIACEKTGRICYMMEIDPVYCDVIRQRYENFILQK